MHLQCKNEKKEQTSGHFPNERRGTKQVLGVWAEPFTTLRLQKIFNLMQDPFERADTTSNTNGTLQTLTPTMSMSALGGEADSRIRACYVGS